MGLSDERYRKKGEEIDMETSFRILNLPDSSTPTEPVTRQEMEAYLSDTGGLT
jgi:hypothetical protein